MDFKLNALAFRIQNTIPCVLRSLESYTPNQKPHKCPEPVLKGPSDVSGVKDFSVTSEFLRQYSFSVPVGGKRLVG